MLQSNEIVAEGPMNSPNSQINYNYKEESRRSLSSAVVLSLTKVNSYFKIDSSIGVWVSYEHRVAIKVNSETMMGALIAKREVIYWDLNCIIILSLKFNTGKDSNNTQVYNLYFYRTTIKCGNLVKYSLFYVKWIRNCIQYNLSTRKINYVRKNLYVLKSIRLDAYRLDGGKITEKANASSNVDDTRIKILSLSNIDLSSWPLNKGKQNSVLRYKVKLNLYQVRNYSIKNPAKDRKDSRISWPSNKELLEMEESVFYKQIDLVLQAKKFGIHSGEVMKLQFVLASSFEFRVVAIYYLAKSNGSLTPGIDGNILSTKSSAKEKLDMVERLKFFVRHSDKYRAQAVKRVYIKKANGKLRPLGIPSIFDRGFQYLLKLVVEPLVEMSSDKHSYGFRKHRSAKNAIGILRSQFKTTELKTENKWVLDADIKGFFDNINHDWILANIPLNNKLKVILKDWLKSGHIDKGVFYMSESGTPQGGVISPCLANFTLNGLEDVTFSSITKSKERRFHVKHKDGTKFRYSLNLFIVRYADDFVIIARSKHILIKYVLPKVNEFLMIRGLCLSKEKTKIFTLSDEKSELNFLGYTLKYRSNWKYKRAFIFRHSGSRAVGLYPNKEKVYAVIKKMKEIIKKSQNLTSYSLISMLNPIIVGWANYYNIGNCARFRDYIRQALWKLTWRWCIRKHKRWGKKKITKHYFQFEEGKKFKGRLWTFYGVTNSVSRYKSTDNKEKKKRIFLQDISSTNKILAAKEYIIPNKIIDIHAYETNVKMLIDFQSTVNLKSLSRYNPKLLIKQDNLCSVCNQLITLEQMSEGLIHIHHINPIFKGGSSNKLENMELLHSWCHRSINHFDLPEIH
jgi:RNA-directed DNA polymerase